MAEADWTVLDNSLNTASVIRGVSAGVTKPNGGGSFAYGFHSVSSNTGTVGLYTNQTNFSPMIKGGRVTGALLKGSSPADSGWSSCLFFSLQGTDVSDQGYLLGLSDAEPARLVLRKASLAGGIPDLAPIPETNGNLMQSTTTFSKGTWIHVRLDVISETNGDVVLAVYQNNLAVNSVGSPVWTTIPGMEGPFYPEITGFVDDHLQVNTGSAPLIGGRAGFAFTTSGGAARRSYFDHITITRQV